MLIRRETPEDVSDVDAIHRAAFGRGVEADLLSALRFEGDLVPPLCRVAVAEGRVVGSAVCSTATVDGVQSQVVGLGPVGVLPEHQGRGVGSALLHNLLGASDAMGLHAVVLLGSPGYYGRFGFEPATAYGVVPPVEQWASFFQLRVLSSWDGSAQGGFRYAPAFERLDPASA